MNATFRLGIVCAGLLSSSCNLEVGGPAIELPTGVRNIVIDTADLQIPPELQGAEIASIPCADDSTCPSSETFETLCIASVCNPSPYVLEGALGEPIDLDELAEAANSPIARIESVQITYAAYEFEGNSLNLELPEVELFWAGEEVADLSGPVVSLGRLPAVTPGQTPSGDVPLDQAGVEALSDHLLSFGRARFFARTAVDLEPGQTAPMGRATLGLQLRVRIQGAFSL